MKIVAISLLFSLVACAPFAPVGESVDVDPMVNPWTQAAVQDTGGVAVKPFTSSALQPAWQHYEFPGKVATQFTYLHQEGRHAMEATAMSSASMLRRAMRVAPQDLGSVKFSWKVPELIAQADLAARDRADSPVRIVLVFEGDRAKFSAKNAMLSELSQAITGEPLPYATLMYVWCNTRAPGTVIVSPRTDRIRKLVVESGGKKLNQWLDYERNIRVDFEHVFGESPGALIGIGIMTDADNTHSTTRAWYGQLRLTSLNRNASNEKNAPASVLTTLK